MDGIISQEEGLDVIYVSCAVCGKYMPATEAVWVGNQPFCQECVEPMELPYSRR